MRQLSYMQWNRYIYADSQIFLNSKWSHGQFPRSKRSLLFGSSLQEKKSFRHPFALFYKREIYNWLLRFHCYDAFYEWLKGWLFLKHFSNIEIIGPSLLHFPEDKSINCHRTKPIGILFRKSQSLIYSKLLVRHSLLNLQLYKNLSISSQTVKRMCKIYHVDWLEFPGSLLLIGSAERLAVVFTETKLFW